jgi:hypothetical protein
MSTVSTKFQFKLADPTDVFDNDAFLKGNFSIIEQQVYSKTEIDARTVYGSNVNGNYVKFPDGTMICYFSKTVTSSGVSYYSQDGVPFPIAFIDSNIKVMITGYNAFHGYSQSNCNSPFAVALTNSTVRWGILFQAAVNTGYDVSANMIAIGRWK